MKSSLKNTVILFTALILTVFVASFGASVIRQKASRKKSVNASTLSADSAAKPASSTNNEPGEQPPQAKAVFYTSVGGAEDRQSSPRTANRMTSRYTIEVATLHSQAEAERLLSTLKAKGLDGFYTPMRRGGEVIYHVRMGLFTNPKDAETTQSKIARAASIKGVVTKLQ